MAEPPWSRTSVEDVNENEKPKSFKLNRYLPTLLTPQDELTMDDMLMMIEEAVNQREPTPIDELVLEFTQAQSPSATIEKPKTKTVLEYLNSNHEIEDSSPLTTAEIPRLRQHWLDEFADILGGVPDKLPPLRVINHTIPLIDPEKRYRYYMPRCPDSLRGQLAEKIDRYMRAGWWEPKTVSQAAPMLCIPKKDGKLRTTIDCRERNSNTIKDVTPLPDQDRIRMQVAGAKFRSKIDLSDAYEQVRVVPEDVVKTAFATPSGTYLSHVMQQGDTNAPSTFQRLMNTIFREYIGVFMHVYLDDIFVFSNSIEEHERHLRLVFERLREHQL